MPLSDRIANAAVAIVLVCAVLCYDWIFHYGFVFLLQFFLLLLDD